MLVVQHYEFANQVVTRPKIDCRLQDGSILALSHQISGRSQKIPPTPAAVSALGTADDDVDTVTREFIVGTKSGLHARPAAQIARAVHRFDANVTLWKGVSRADAKSVFSILILEAGPGSTIKAEASGPERDQAIAALSNLFENNFQEGTG